MEDNKESKKPMQTSEVKHETVGGRRIRTDVTSSYIRDEIKKGGDRTRLDHLLTIEHWILTGDNRSTYDGLFIPHFSNNHPSQLAERYKAEYWRILEDVKGTSGIAEEKKRRQEKLERRAIEEVRIKLEQEEKELAIETAKKKIFSSA